VASLEKRPTRRRRHSTITSLLSRVYCIGPQVPQLHKPQQPVAGGELAVPRLQPHSVHGAQFMQTSSTDEFKGYESSIGYTEQLFIGDICFCFYRAMHFSAKCGIEIACRPSVCLSVTLVDQDHIGWISLKLIIVCTISPTPSLFVAQR